MAANPAPVAGNAAGIVVLVDDAACVTGAVEETGGIEDTGGGVAAGGGVGCGATDGGAVDETGFAALREIGGLLEAPSLPSPAGTGEIPGTVRSSGSSRALTPPAIIAADIVQMMARVRNNAAARRSILDMLPMLTFLLFDRPRGRHNCEPALSLPHFLTALCGVNYQTRLCCSQFGDSAVQVCSLARASVLIYT
ncbi:MAG: hypothetical protein U0232_08105 [Thermomicrobiales bacterium]